MIRRARRAIALAVIHLGISLYPSPEDDSPEDVTDSLDDSPEDVVERIKRAAVAEAFPEVAHAVRVPVTDPIQRSMPWRTPCPCPICTARRVNS